MAPLIVVKGPDALSPRDHCQLSPPFWSVSVSLMLSYNSGRPGHIMSVAGSSTFVTFTVTAVGDYAERPRVCAPQVVCQRVHVCVACRNERADVLPRGTVLRHASSVAVRREGGRHILQRHVYDRVCGHRFGTHAGAECFCELTHADCPDRMEPGLN